MVLPKKGASRFEMSLNKAAAEDLDDDYSDESDSESDSDPEDVKLSEPSKTSIYNREGLQDKLAEISWPENVDWIHKLSLSVDREQEVDVNDDLTRELAFYTQALEGTREAFVKFESMKLPFLRPSDYYAEMVKTDGHMEKVKGRLLAEKRRIEEAEERKKARESKKIAKEVQVQKSKERTKQKKEEIESVKKWRKQRQQTGYPSAEKGDGDMGLPFEEPATNFERSNKKRPGVKPGDRSGGKSKFGTGKNGGVDKKRKRREAKDTKFGYGGKNGTRKQNTAETTSDLRGYNKGDSSTKNKKRRF
jgi:rRNA-processing protein EBP2